MLGSDGSQVTKALDYEGTPITIELSQIILEEQCPCSSAILQSQLCTWNHKLLSKASTWFLLNGFQNHCTSLQFAITIC